jgi:hypothetical protein
VNGMGGASKEGEGAIECIGWEGVGAAGWACGSQGGCLRGRGPGRGSGNKAPSRSQPAHRMALPHLKPGGTPRPRSR